MKRITFWLAGMVSMGVATCALAGSSPKKTTGVITACYAVSGGALRIIESGSCHPANEKTLSWQSGAVQLRGDIGRSDPDQVILKKDNVTLSLQCTGLPEFPTAALKVHSDVATNVAGTFVTGNAGPTQPEIISLSVLGDARVASVSQSFEGISQNQGQLVIDTSNHVISVVYRLVADDHDVPGGSVDRCRIVGTATLS